MTASVLSRSVMAAALACLALGWSTPAAGARVSIPPGDLREGLRRLARQTGAELLYDEGLVRGRRGASVQGNLTAEAALARLLVGAGLGYRRTGDGALVLFALASAPATQRSLAGPGDWQPIPEILVIGRRSQNVDIRRRESDVQPYQVATGEQIIRAHRDNLDGYFRSRVPSNTQVLAPTLLDNGETISEIDLRGLGTDGTLVLIDGRRLPSIPASANPLAFRQPDLNAVPLHSIERVETLTGTAGGIYGFGALGGVVNVVLKRDYRGLELHGTAGISSRGDARRIALEGRFGFTPDQGRTDVMLFLSHSWSEPLRVGDRGYPLRDRRKILERDPVLFASLFRSNQNGNSITVLASNPGEPLVFKPEFGGASLGADRTFLPLNFEGSQSDLVNVLTEKGGQIDLSLADQQARSYLGSQPRTSAAMMNVRRSFSGGHEAFLDAVLLRNSGRHMNQLSTDFRTIARNAPGNPFNNQLTLFIPRPGANRDRRASFETERYTGGVIVSLPHRWRGTGEATIGSARYSSDVDEVSYFSRFTGDLNPFAPWSDVERALLNDAERVASINSQRIRTKYQAQSVRLAGPLFSLGEQDTTLTLLAERIREKVPEHVRLRKFEFSRETFSIPTAGRTSRTTSFYAELRAPLTGPALKLPLFRSLEVQLAIRREALRVDFSSDPTSEQPFIPDDDVRRTFAASSYTAGAKVSPSRWLLLRGSYATGRLPPLLEFLVQSERVVESFRLLDPKRENRSVRVETPILARGAGSPDLDMIRARTMFVGAVLTPFGPDGARLSIDYSRVRRTGDPYLLNANQVLLNEDDWPERVERAPLTEEDRAAGFTGGQITALDARATNGRNRSVRTLDARLDWPVRLLGGDLRLYGAGSIQLQNVDKGLLDAAVGRIGFRTGPLRWRGNIGADWSKGPLSVGANIQYFGRYRINTVAQTKADTEALTRLQGSAWVSPQAYLDLHAGRRLRLGSTGREVSIDIGIVNLLDTAPPREVGVLNGGPGYSRYGDPRRRRFEIMLGAEF